MSGEARAHLMQHVPFEGPGSIAPWLAARGVPVTSTRFFEAPTLPTIEDVDLLIVLGGPMSVNDEQAFPWLVQEKTFLRRFVDSGKPVLGICLGAQLLASAMGARVYPNRAKEIGWYPVFSVSRQGDPDLRFPDGLDVFHWHGETFDLPSGAVQLARSEACENQAFQLGSSVVGLQFHLETTPETARQIVAHCREELQPSAFVQSEKTVLDAGADRYEAINAQMEKVLTWLAGTRFGHAASL